MKQTDIDSPPSKNWKIKDKKIARILRLYIYPIGEEIPRGMNTPLLWHS
jgi:hypothetical protein